MRVEDPPRPLRSPQTRWPALNRALAHVAHTVRQARAVPARDWAATIAFAAANWLLDVACLAAVAHACQLNIGYGHLAGAYLAAQIVRQLPLTPGGIGLIETSLLAGFVAAGAAQTNAAAAVLGYRLISFWLLLPVGLATYLGLRRRDAASRSQPAAATESQVPS
ncbi:YbhN family protein [Actinomycetes bacterium KLBMP 9797]